MKTKQSFRKKALLSSVAMLLVAAVAVGSATFAWFTQNDSATASGINLQTMRGSSLKVSSLNNDWASSINYNKGQTDDKFKMYPASTADGVSWFHTHAAAAGNFTSTTAEIENVSDNENGHYYFADMLNVQCPADGANNYEDIKIVLTNFSGNVSGNPQKNTYTKIALVEVQSKEVHTPKGDVSFVDSVYGNDNEEYQAIKDSNRGAAGGYTTPITTKAITNSTTSLVSPFSLSPGEEKYFMLYIWFEGQDKNCYDNAGFNELGNLNFVVSGTRVLGD